jgi:1-acyl-sn-glycerol-3-phosphate acyltransferase
MFQTDCAGFLTKIYANAPPRRTLAANILFKIPLFRDYVLWFCTIDASPRTANSALAQGMTLQVVTGGEHEQLLANDQSPVLVIKKRKGIARLALHYNVPIVPAFVFGEDSLYETYDWLLDWRLKIVKKFRVAITFQKGHWGLPFWPKRGIPLIAVIGDPIYLTKEERSNKELRKGHDGKYDMMTAMYKQYR